MKIFSLISLIFILGYSSSIYGSILNKNAKQLANHHNNQEIFELMAQVNKKCPDITYIYDLPLKSVKGLPLRVIAFSDNPQKHEEGEPEFKYVANMHGNEVVGREMLVELMDQLCDAYLNSNQNVMDLIQSTRIHLLPTMNPDGWDLAAQHDFKRNKNIYKDVADMLERRGVTHWMIGRANANDVDLNRNFPDLDVWEYKYQSEGKEKFDHLVVESAQEINNKHVDCVNKTFQPETLAVAKWIEKNPFVLSANLHGGDFVVNYPYDDSKSHKTSYSATPDDELFKDIAYTFAYYHANMTDMERKPCDMVGDGFHDGITNGAQWYPVCGGMQDYNYLSSNCFEVTIELGCNKFPAGKELKQYWKDNVNAFYEFIWLSHIGIKGVVSHNGKPVADAKIIVARITDEGPELIEHHISTTKNGEYWRLLSDGSYIVLAETADGRQSSPIEISIKNVAYSEAIELNIELDELPNESLDEFDNQTNDEKYVQLLKEILAEEDEY